ncbi:MAG: hypothetical protein AMXMBFR78_01540 [Rubrivivax sp.]
MPAPSSPSRLAARHRLARALARLPLALGQAAAALVFALLLPGLSPCAQARSDGAGGEPPTAIVEITQVLRTEADGAHFPVEARAERVSLPDAWSQPRAAPDGARWYRAVFTLPPTQAQAQALLGLQIARACASFELQLNGQILHRSGRLEAPYALECDRPQLLTLPPALLQPGENRLDLRLVGYPLAAVAASSRAAGLSPLVVAPLQALQSRQRLLTTLQLRLPQALGATLLLTGGFMFVLGFLNRHESHLAYFGALSVGWALLDAQLWVQEWPLPHAAVELMLAALLPLLAWAAVQFLLRYGRLRHRAIDLALPLQALLVPLTLAVVPAQRLHLPVLAWSALLALEVGTAALFYLHRQWRERSASFWLMGALLLVVAACSGIELAAQFVWVPALAQQLARLALPLMLILVGLRLVQQHSLARQQAEVSRSLLEQRVREAAAEIERNFRQLSELKVEQVTERERKRIAADLHDDLGAKLLTIVHTSESERISTLAREALEEMRLSVRGLTGRAVRLADALGDWRAEVVSRLAQAGIETEWSAPEDLPQTLSARAYVQTTRILREATSNIIKHSGASWCSVHCQVSDGDFQLVVRDNGEGISSEPDGRLDRGHGMATMKQRAKQLQGQCLIESGPGFGTVIRLTLPLERALELP